MKESDISLTAWAGWWFSVPATWRFFQMEGGYSKGKLVLGDDDQVRLELTWAWVTKRNFDAENYIRKFLEKGGSRSMPRRVRTLPLEGFSVAAVIETDVALLGVGFCRETSRLLHWVHHGNSRERIEFIRELLPSWKDQPLDMPTRWRFFDIDFSVPAGFRLESAVLNLGDMEIVLTDPSTWECKHELKVRHIYPASLAISRQPLEKWLRDIFKSRKNCYRIKGDIRPATDGLMGVVMNARLPLLLRSLFRPFVPRMPSLVEASIYHIEAINRLVYIQIASTLSRTELTRDYVLRNIQLEPTR